MMKRLLQIKTKKELKHAFNGALEFDSNDYEYDAYMVRIYFDDDKKRIAIRLIGIRNRGKENETWEWNIKSVEYYANMYCVLHRIEELKKLYGQ